MIVAVPASASADDCASGYTFDQTGQCVPAPQQGQEQSASGIGGPAVLPPDLSANTCGEGYEFDQAGSCVSTSAAPTEAPQPINSTDDIDGFGLAPQRRNSADRATWAVGWVSARVAVRADVSEGQRSASRCGGRQHRQGEVQPQRHHRNLRRSKEAPRQSWCRRRSPESAYSLNRSTWASKRSRRPSGAAMVRFTSSSPITSPVLV